MRIVWPRRRGTLLAAVGALAVAGAVTAVAALAPSAGATPPDWLDTTYATEGVAAFAGGHSSGEGTVDGRGRAYTVTTDSTGDPGSSVLRRLTTDGSVDATFAGGAVTLPGAAAGTRTVVHAGPTGAVTVMRAGDAGGVAVLRVTDTGMPDPSFGSGGAVTYLAPVPVQSPMAIIDRPGGGLLLLATAASAGVSYLVALTADGSLDPTWAAGEPTPGVLAVIAGLRDISGDGDRVVALRNAPPALLRFTAAGVLDSTFGDGGQVPLDQGYTGLTAAGGSYYAQGLPVEGGWQAPAILKVLGSGEIDVSFGVDGVALGVPGASCPLDGFAPVAVGNHLYSVNHYGDCAGFGPLGVNRFTASGELDSTYGDGGVVLVDELAGQQLAGGGLLGVSPEGRLVLAFEAPGNAGEGQELYAGVLRLRNTAAGTVPPGGYVPLEPTRLLDTREGVGAPAGAVPGGGEVVLEVAGHGGVPASGVSAVVLTVTVTGPEAGGYLTVHPAGTELPLASNLNFGAGQTVSNLVIVRVGDDAAVSVHNGSPGPAHVVADVAGYYVAGAPMFPGTFASLEPARLLDTRAGRGREGTAPVAAQATLDLTVAGAGGVPLTGAAAVVLNVTVTGPTSGGHVTVFPTGTPAPLTSNLNFGAGQTTSNLVTVKLGAGRQVSLLNGSAGTAHLVADVAGYYLAGAPTEPGTFVPLEPSRLLDTRDAASVPGDGALDLVVAGKGGVPASGVAAVVLNTTVTGPGSAGYLTAYPTGTTPALASNLTFDAGGTVPNLVIVKIGAGGSVSFLNGSPAASHLLADVAGYFLA